MKQFCGNCRYYTTPQCWEKKNSGKHPPPDDWCFGWRKILSFYEREQIEDARMEAAEVRREMREAKG